VGEPLKLTLSWKARRSVQAVAVEQDDFPFQSILLSVDDGSGARLYREQPHQLLEKPLVRRTLAAGEDEIVNLVFFTGGFVEHPADEARESLLFAHPGPYAVTAFYVHDGVRLSGVASNTLRFRVREPGGADADVLRELRRDPALAGLTGGPQTLARARALLDSHPDSAYLRLARLERYREQQDALHNERDPVSGESIHALGREGMAAFRRQHYRRMAEEILAREDWGPFEEEALALASLYAHGAGDEEMRTRARKLLLERFPDSATVRRIRETEPEDEP
jgi:hypothetical protein